MQFARGFLEVYVTLANELCLQELCQYRSNLSSLVGLNPPLNYNSSRNGHCLQKLDFSEGLSWLAVYLE